ncbi:MAG: transketolase [Planctomycetota bacterium]|nr:transketolase [Planctomycetota bacterium]RLS38574.1 MAG: transketolase [Planctomycetota bacterium]
MRNQNPNHPAPAGLDRLGRLKNLAQAMRRGVLDRAYAAGIGHIGSALSVVDILAVLWGSVLRDAGSTKSTRDRFVLCKGHAALALYAAMRHTGRMDQSTFETYCREGTHLGVHPEPSLEGIDVGTGSLGQGLSVACGLACGLRMERSPARCYALLSDAECNEGQVWEAAQFAAHHRLHNLTALIDANGTQAMGRTEQVLDLGSLAKKWEAFGWHAVEANGHDHGALLEALEAPGDGRPRMIVAHTVLGKGVSYMEDRVAWHYQSMTAEQYTRALLDLDCDNREAAA